METFKLFTSFVAGMIAAFMIVAIINIRILRRRRKKRKKVSLNTYTKLITTAVVAHGMTLTSFSYILAYLGMNTIMNIFEKNKLSFSVPLNMELINKETQNSNTDTEAVG